MKIFKTTFKVVVLTEDAPVNSQADLVDVIRDFTDGDSIGEVTYEGCHEVPSNRVHAELLAIGNDGSFFSLEDETSA